MANQTYYWVLPVMGAFFSLIALLFPAAYFEVTIIISIESRIWMWGYVYLKMAFKETSGFGTAPDFLLVCMVSTLIVIISAIMLIISANNVRINNKTATQVKKQWLIFGILLIFAPIFWSVMMESFAPGFWDLFDVGFGLIGIIIGGIIAIIGSLISK